MRRLALAALMVITSFAVGSRAAYGIAMLRLDDGLGNVVTIADNGPGDLNAPTTGAITWSGTVGAWNLNVTTGVTKPLTGSPTSPSMDLNSIDMSSGPGVHTITLLFSDTDFGPTPAGWNFADLIGGTTDGTVVAKQLYGANNLNFQGIVIANQSFTGPAFSGTFYSAGVAGVAPYSLTQVVEITHNGTGMTSFDYAKHIVPEPASILLLGSGLAGFGYLRRRRRG